MCCRRGPACACRSDAPPTATGRCAAIFDEGDEIRRRVDVCRTPRAVLAETGPRREVDVANESDLELRELYVFAPGAAAEGPDRLGTSTVPPGETFKLRLRGDAVRDCVFDLRAVFADDSQERRQRLDLCRAPRVVFGDPDLPTREVPVLNRARRTLRELYAAPAQPDAAAQRGQRDWGPDRLGSAVVAPRESFRMRVRSRACAFDVRAVFEDDSQEVQRNLDLCVVQGVVFGDAATADAAPRRVTLVNQHRRVIQQAFLSPTESRDWGDDVLGTEVLPVGGRFEARAVSGCRADLRIIFDSNAAEERRDIDICANTTVTFRPGWTVEERLEGAAGDSKAPEGSAGQSSTAVPVPPGPASPAPAAAPAPSSPAPAAVPAPAVAARARRRRRRPPRPHPLPRPPRRRPRPATPPARQHRPQPPRRPPRGGRSAPAAQRRRHAGGGTLRRCARHRGPRAGPPGEQRARCGPGPGIGAARGSAGLRPLPRRSDRGLPRWPGSAAPGPGSLRRRGGGPAMMCLRLGLLLLLALPLPAAAQPAGAAGPGIPEALRGAWLEGPSCARPGALLFLTARAALRVPPEEGPPVLLRFAAVGAAPGGWTLGTAPGAEGGASHSAAPRRTGWKARSRRRRPVTTACRAMAPPCGAGSAAPRCPSRRPRCMPKESRPSPRSSIWRPPVPPAPRCASASLPCMCRRT